MKRRKLTPFSLSFLDVMFCGFGAVVLLVMLLNGRTLTERRESHAEQAQQLRHLQQDATARDRVVAELDAALARAQAALSSAQNEAVRLRRQSANDRQHIAALSGDDTSRSARLEQLKRELKELDQKVSTLRLAQAQSGAKLHTFSGQGNRQYLTGLKLDGKRIMILLDISASMLDRTVVNVIRVRNMAPERRRQAEKWRHTVRAVKWILANMSPQSRFQIYVFNSEAHGLLPGTDGSWLDPNDRSTMTKTDAALANLAPEQGTNLYKAFTAARGMRPMPDNILLLTDGLPTQGRSKPHRATISGEARLDLARAAIKTLGFGIPVNTLLFPMVGDPVAAALFWWLATRTGGAFITPSSDWP